MTGEEFPASTVSEMGTINLYDFARRGRRASSYKSALGIGDALPLPAPWTLEIEPTLLCNADCVFCSYAEDIRRARDMSYVSGLPWSRVADVLVQAASAGTRGFLWSGGGEPTTWPHIDEALTLSATLGAVSLQTNGMLLDRVARDRQSAARFAIISISAVAHTEQLHRAIMRRPGFERIIRNIGSLVRLQNGSYKPLITVKILVCATNRLLLPEIVRFYELLGVDSIALRLVQDYNYGSDGPRAESVELGARERDELVSAIERSSYRHQSLDALARGLRGRSEKLPLTAHCYTARDGHFACIDAHGDVYVGNPEIGNREYAIGNVLSRRWHEIWGSARHLQVIARMDKEQQQGLCPSELCRHVRAHRGVESAQANISPASEDPLEAFL